MLMRPSTIPNQNGAAMVEMALVITLFISMIFAIFEFALAVFYAARLSEATRAGARAAVVNSATITDVKDLGCTDIGAMEYQQCDAVTCGTVVAAMNKVVNIEPENIYIRYRCAKTGYTKEAGYAISNQEIYSITVKLQDVHYPLLLPGILGIQTFITMPSFETTRLSEDLWSQTE